MATAEQYAKYIAAMMIAIVVDGLFAGYCFHEGLDDLLFVPLHVGLALVFVLYFFIEKRANLLAGEAKTPKYRNLGRCGRKNRIDGRKATGYRKGLPHGLRTRTY